MRVPEEAQLARAGLAGCPAHGRAALGPEAADETKTRSDRHGVRSGRCGARGGADTVRLYILQARGQARRRVNTKSKITKRKMQESEGGVETAAL